MTRLVFALLTLVLLAAPLTVEAQQSGEGVLRHPLARRGSRSLLGRDTNLVPVARRELGYVVGGNLVIERRFAEGKAERLPRLARMRPMSLPSGFHAHTAVVDVAAGVARVPRLGQVL
jgi:hypothetical protein